ncbi:sulfonate transport system permease protein [Parafrankia irregularis]|uniref:Sulfonate transport system permease protein n=1 Tax=Parafrankia irregularis TaxID=795642 RepID=A0A0S4QMY5_9ACTN|nr:MULTISPECIES: ABC transporter permease subunit [Parafrankia]MBE3201167.1 ABC transporter permease subunit [Parafrankia sp. CH37]CUU56398.1 sulfonate transport system permease protein [Parafrankia irregularis]
MSTVHPAAPAIGEEPTLVDTADAGTAHPAVATPGTAGDRPPSEPETLLGKRPTRRLGWRPPRLLRRGIGPLLLLALWQLGSTTGAIAPDTMPAPDTIVTTAWDLLRDGSLPEALVVSLRRVTYGLLLGGLAGLVLGLLSGLFRIGEDLIDAPMQMLRTLPFLGLIPLLIIWFGIGETPKITLVALGTAFPIYLNTYAAIRNVDGRLVEAAETLGLRRWQLVVHVILPGALPGVLVGLRYSLGVGWLALVIGEQVNADAGIGFLMMQAREFLQTEIVIVCLIVYSLLGLASDVAVRLLEKGALSWRRGFSGR